MRRAATFQPVVKSSSSKKTGKTVDLDAALQFDAAGMTKSAFAAQVVFVTLITTALFAGFVMFFFFVIASKVERQVVQKSVTGLVDEFVGDAQVLLPPAQLAQLRAAASTLQPPSAADADAEVTARNKSLLKHAAIVLGVAVIVIAAAVTIAYFAMRAGVKKYKPGQAKPGAGYPDMSNVLLVSVCSLAAAAVAEFAFLYTVAARYQPLDNNAAKHALVTQLLAIGAQAPSK
jgi:zinc transporter ZupT